MSSNAAPWRAWYKSARWRGTKKNKFMDGVRGKVLIRDGFICQRTGVLLIGKHPAPNSPVVDHIQPHRGDERLFWDETNLMAVSKVYHDSQKQVEEQASLQTRGVWD